MANSLVAWKARRSRMRAARSAAKTPALHLEPLESRTLLNGVTVIAHGAELFGGLGESSRPVWIDFMGSAIAARYGGNTAIYALRIEPNGSGVKVASFNRLSGAANSAAGTSGETVLLLDWAEASNVNLFSLRADYSSTLIANTVIPYLTTAMPNVGINAPLAEGAIQLIGHSRGGSVISEIAKSLGASGIWVDQITFLDPRPVPPDPLTVGLPTNVIFSDNYYQTSGDGLFTPNGVRVNGSLNTGPLKVDGPGLGSTHNNIVLFYQGTIDTANGNIGGIKPPATWYSGNSLNRASTGFYYAHGAGGAWNRPASGIGTTFGGSGARSNVSRSGAQWANVATINVSTTTVGAGQAFATSFRYNSVNSAATLQWFFDPDTNPYNNNSIPLGAASPLAATGDAPVLTGLNVVAAGALGTYNLVARITNAAGSRYTYANQMTISNATPIGSIDLAGPAAVQGWVVDPDNPSAAVTVRLDVNGITLATIPANQNRPDLVAAFGSANHGYTFDLSGLADGTYKVELFGVDTSTGEASLIAARTLSTNHTPIGSIDWFDGSILAGWAIDPDNTAAAIKIRYQVDNHAPVILTAQATRNDLTAHFGSADHGYALVLPQLTAGQHTITVYAIDPVSQALTLLGTRTATVASPADNTLPTGSIDVINTTRVAGWTYDPTAPTTSINIRIDVDGVVGTPAEANLTRNDLQNAIGSTNHGYSQQLTLTPGQHRIDVFAIDSTSGRAVLLGSRIVGSTVPVGSIDVLSTSQIAGWVYQGALAAGGATTAIYRIDIDSLPGAVANTSLSRPDVVSAYTAGNWGYSLSMPQLTAGTHTVSLVAIDPLTLVSTPLVTRTLVI